jgi:type VI secretion system protein ImpL
MAKLYVIWLLAAVTLLALAILLWYRNRKKANSEGQAGQSAAPTAEEIDLAFYQVEAKLAAAKWGRRGRIRNLPVFLLVGDPGAAKTSIMLHSGLEPELLSGQVYRNSDVVPTTSVNTWLSQQALFVEAGGTLLSQPEKWKMLVRNLLPRGPVVGKGEQAPRAAIVCYDCGNFLQASPQEAVATAARSLRTRLGEISEVMGIDLPVYVLFTKMDQLPFFAEYVSHFSNDEAHQVLGTTLPILANRSSGVYAEAETTRLTDNFDGLFRSLADGRTEFLARENDAARLPATYEFPREFRKIRLAAVQFLLDLCRPSQLSVGPFLRGFYFSGVRPVLITETVPMRVNSAPAESESPSGATQIFRREVPLEAPQASAPAHPYATTRKVPQWMFLRHLFHGVVLPDRAAQGASGVSVKTISRRWILLGSITLLFLLLAIGFTVSFFRNLGLERRVRDAAVGISSNESTGLRLAPADALRRLEVLRQSLELLTAYRRDGSPWSLRWGLYAGDSLYREAYRLYFASFGRLLLGTAQTNILRDLGSLPDVPGPEFGPTYDLLKAYLITTSNHDKSSRMFLTPVLLRSWGAGVPVDSERQALAQKQFDFYADQLKEENPFPGGSDPASIERARRYLAQFAGTERVYTFMAAEAAKSGSVISFNRQFPGSASTVLETHEVGGAFSKAGWMFMKDALEHADRYFNGEKWVLGERSAAQIDLARFEQDLRARYYADFLREWRLFIKSASVVRYADTKDAVGKLGIISSNQSPLLALLSLASQNTAVDDPAVAAVFQPVQAVVPPGSTDRYIAPPNRGYIDALITLQASLENSAEQTDDPAQTLTNALQAKVVTRQMAQSFRLDSEGHIEAAVQKLLEDPIIYVEQALRGAAPAELNSGGKELCTQFRGLAGKFPFNPKSKIDATPADVNAIFRRPDGALWSFYEKSLKKALTKQGAQYVPSGAVPLTPDFVTFFNAAAAFSEALYSADAKDPGFAYTVKPGLSDGVQGMTLRVDGQTVTYATSNPIAAKTFTWQAKEPHDVTVSVRVGGAEFEWQHHTGMWGIFHFFAEAKRSAGQVLEWPVGAGSQQFKADGKPVTVRLEVDLGPMTAVLHSHGLGCVAEVAR